jgi:hypothetical protein
MDFIASLRPVCETIFYFLLLGYTTGIHAQYQRSCARGEESTDAWQNAKRLVEQAMQHAITATAQAAGGDYIEADKVAKYASEHLKARFVLTFVELEGSQVDYGVIEIALQLYPQNTNDKSATSCRSGMKNGSMLHEFCAFFCLPYAVLCVVL